MTTLTVVKQIIEHFTHNSSADFSEKLALESIANWDSLVALQVMTALETQFSIKIPIYKFIEAKSIGDILKLIE